MVADPASVEVGFCSGVSLGAGRCRVPGLIPADRRSGTAKSVLLEWSREGGWQTIVDSDLTLTRSASLPGQPTLTYLMGMSGIGCLVVDSRVTEEPVDESDTGPAYRGNIRDLRLIGDKLYVAGMSRQVYRRETSGRWTHQDTGTVQPLGTLGPVGFNAIAGRTEADLYAVGFGGEIWRRLNGAWLELDSPTNVVLLAVRVAESGTVFVCGQKGVILRGEVDAFESINQDLTDMNFWDMEFFNGVLYLAAEKGLFRLSDGQLAPVDTGFGPDWSYRHLHAAHGALWSFGDRHLAWSDGETWHGVT